MSAEKSGSLVVQVGGVEVKFGRVPRFPGGDTAGAELFCGLPVVRCNPGAQGSVPIHVGGSEYSSSLWPPCCR